MQNKYGIIINTTIKVLIIMIYELLMMFIAIL